MSVILDKNSDIFRWVEMALNRHENVSSVTEVSTQGGTDVGDGYTGQVISVCAKTQKNYRLVEYNLVVKKSVQDEKTRDVMNIKLAYDREMYTYCKILPEFNKFEIENGAKPFDLMAKCYGGYIFGTQEVLIFENLKTLGYRLHDIQKPMDKNHRNLILEACSHWHALSLCLKAKKSELFSKLFDNLEDPWGKYLETNDMQNMMLGAQKLTSDVLKESKEFDLLENFEKKYEDGLLKICEDLLKTGKKDKYAVFAHSDCWHNNLMFKYEENDLSQPTRVALLDFQNASLNSIAFDLSYYLYFVTPTEEVPLIKEDLKFYYDCLSKRITELGCDRAQIFPFEELSKQWKCYSVLGVIMGLLWLPNSMSDKEDVLSTLNGVSEDTTRNLVNLMKPNTKEKLFKHIVSIVRHNIENHF